MQKFFMLMFLCFFVAFNVNGQHQTGIIKTSIVIQKWNIENVQDPISEATFPIEISYPIRENMNFQLSHSPAVSRFGDLSLAGLSDTWLHASYAFMERRALVSIGLGLPTGNTRLDSSETSLAYLLSQNAFKFRLPVFGQGVTFSCGVMYAYPMTDNLTIGAGFNYVVRGKYQYSKLQPNSYDPGNQLGVNLGFDYVITPQLRSNVDVIINYYGADRLKNTKVFESGMRFCGKIGVQYQANFGLLWLRTYYSFKAKNETWDGQALVPDEKNSNITLRELEGGTKIFITDILSLLVQGEIRSYVENELDQGWVDIFGPGLGYELSVFHNFLLSMGFNLFFGDGQIGIQNPALSGLEFKIGTQWKF